MRYALLLITVTGLLLGQGTADIVISQIYGGGGNSGAQYRNDYVELLNRGKSPVNIDGWSVQYASATGTSWQVTPLRGSIPAGRYYLVQEAAGANVAAPPVPSPDATGEIAMSATAGQVAVVRSTTALAALSGAVDYVAYTGLGNSTAALRRGGGCLDTDSFSADFQIGEPRPRNSQTEAVNCDAPQPVPVTVRISEIQGAGARSPLENRFVKTRGIVTGKKSNGFWIQSLPDDADNDPVTSEGLWVFQSISPPGTVDRGYVIEVTGTVSEYRPASDPDSPTLTEIVDPQIQELWRGQPLPPPTRLNPGGDWERYEGMRVSAPELRTVSPTLGSVSESSAIARSSGVFYGVLPGEPRPYRSPDATEIIDRVRVDSAAQGGQAVNVTSNTTVRNVIGPLDYAFRTYTVAQDAQESLAAEGGMSAVPVPRPGAREFTVASINLQRFYDDKDDPGQDVVLSPAALQMRIDRAARAIRDILLLPDIIGVEEAENLDVLRALARAAGDYDAQLLAGNDPSGINVGLLVKRGRVQVRTVVQEGRSVQLPSGDPLWDRPPLVAQLTIENVPLTSIVVHLRSLIDADTTTVMAKRQAQAEYLRDLILARLGTNEQVLVMGDFNTYNFDRLMTTIRGGVLLNLSDTLPPGEAYSYVRDGETQSIDHILVSEGLRSRFTRYTLARVDADFPEIARNDPDGVTRLSDHDIPVAYFTLAPEALQLPAAGVLNAATFLGGAVAPLEIVTIYGRNLGPPAIVSAPSVSLPNVLGGTIVLFDGVSAPILYTSSGQVSAVVPTQVAGKASTTLQVQYQGAATESTVLPVAKAAPGVFTAAQSGSGQGAILNQDFSINGPSNPAARGSVVMIYATGGGLLAPTAGDVPPRLMEQVAVRIGGRPAELFYAGQAPGLIQGAVQINARIPMDVPLAGAVPVVITIGDRTSAFGATVSVR